MEKILPIKTDGNLVDYSKALAKFYFSDIKRKSGGNYFESHLYSVAEMAKNISKNEYKDIAEASGYLHDFVEMIRHPFYETTFEVKNPFKIKINGIKKDKNTIYFNDLLFNAGQNGIFVCYILDGLSHRKWLGETYKEHMMKKCILSHDEPKRTLDIVEIIIKACDKKVNLDAIDLRAMELMNESRPKTFEDSLKRNARNYLLHHGPMIEKALFIDAKEKKEVFNKKKTREILKKTLIQCIELQGEEILEKSINSNDNKMLSKEKNYFPIAIEILEDLKDNKYEIKEYVSIFDNPDFNDRLIYLPLSL
jgi:hypothetical protein